MTFEAIDNSLILTVKGTNGGNPLELYRAFRAEVDRRVPENGEHGEWEMDVMAEDLIQVWMEIRNGTIKQPTTLAGWTKALTDVFEDNFRRAKRLMTQPIAFRLVKANGRLGIKGDDSGTMELITAHASMASEKQIGIRLDENMVCQLLSQIIKQTGARPRTGEQWVNALVVEAKRTLKR